MGESSCPVSQPPIDEPLSLHEFLSFALIERRQPSHVSAGKRPVQRHSFVFVATASPCETAAEIAATTKPPLALFLVEGGVHASRKLSPHHGTVARENMLTTTTLGIQRALELCSAQPNWAQ
ncbi:hypothetical protein MRX96_055075 [Rhipicephalus microplus]